MNYQFDQRNVPLKIFVLTFRFLCGHGFHKFLKTFSDVQESNSHFIIFNKILKKKQKLFINIYKLYKNVVKIFNNNPNFYSMFIVKITNPGIIYILSFFIFFSSAIFNKILKNRKLVLCFHSKSFFIFKALMLGNLYESFENKKTA